mmetsp:Transcript_68802/g.109160  ORF Transcript_68802/g.109160 Transcript_68802/m.109160 type:complete len:240 (-) Transcript_68802:48-767(-)
MMEEGMESQQYPGWLWLGDKSWADDAGSAARHALTHRLCCAMSETESHKWMSSWSGRCDCGACPPNGHVDGLGIEDDDDQDELARKRALHKYRFESWTAQETGQDVTVGYVPLFDDEPFCRCFAEPLLVAGSDFIAEAKRSGGKIYVHCEKGCSRSAAVVLCYMMMYEGMSLLDAAITLKGRRVRISPNGALVDALARIEQTYLPTCSDIDAVNAALQRKWLPDYRAGRVRLNNVDLVM